MSQRPTQRRGAARPSSARPGQRGGAGRPRAGAKPSPQSTSKPKFTSRMAILVLVAAVLVVSYASSMRAYLVQRGQINELHSSISKSEAAIEKLEREKARWHDDVFVQSQARARFGWVLPGETSYQVIGRDGKPLSTTDTLADPSAVARTVPTPWWQKVDASITTADHPPKRKTPAVSITPPPAPAKKQ